MVIVHSLSDITSVALEESIEDEDIDGNEEDNEYAVIMRNHNINKENSITAAKLLRERRKIKRRRFHARRHLRIVDVFVDVDAN